MEQTVQWLREGQQRLHQHCAALDDSQILVSRPVPSGEPREIRWIIANLASHDAYHAGEINHIRALHQSNDRWAWEQA